MDRIARLAPVLAGAVHHDLDDERYKRAHDRPGIAELFPIDAAIPRRAAMNELVSQGIEADKNHAEDLAGVAVGKRMTGGPVGTLEALFPVGAVGEPVRWSHQG